MPRPEDLFPRDLGAFLKQAASTLDEVKEQVLRGGQAGKATLDVQLLKRQRDKALQKLGEVLLDEVARGAPLPAACDAVVAEIAEIETQIQTAQTEADRLWNADGSAGRGPSASVAGTADANTSGAGTGGAGTGGAGTGSRRRASDDDDDE
jgi:hypothetical protein